MKIINELLEIVENYTNIGITTSQKTRYDYLSEPLADDYDTLLFSILSGIKGGNPFQRNVNKIFRRHAAIKMLRVFGFSKPVIYLSEKLLADAVKYNMHQVASDLSRYLAKHYAVFENQLSLARDYHERALAHNTVSRCEIIFDWQYQKIRSRINRSSFFKLGEDISKMLEDIEPHKNSSVGLMFIYHELRFFLSYIDKDIEQQKVRCHEAIADFKNLPYQHNKRINVFTFQLINVLINNKELATAELVILQRMEDDQGTGSHAYRFIELLCQVYLKKGELRKARDLLTEMKKTLTFKGFEQRLRELEISVKEYESEI